MKFLGPIFTLLLICQSALAVPTEETLIAQLSWLKGDWQTEFNGNTLQLEFTGEEGGTILSTYKQLNSTNQLIFMRFMYITDATQQLELRLYPFLSPSPDTFVSTQVDASHVVFKRVYENKECDINDIKMAANDNENLQQTCDRFPIQITLTKISENNFSEDFFGFKPLSGKQKDVSFSRIYRKQ